jgi:hypothetical protein
MERESRVGSFTYSGEGLGCTAVHPALSWRAELNYKPVYSDVAGWDDRYEACWEGRGSGEEWFRG